MSKTEFVILLMIAAILTWICFEMRRVHLVAEYQHKALGEYRRRRLVETVKKLIHNDRIISTYGGSRRV